MVARPRHDYGKDDVGPVENPENALPQDEPAPELPWRCIVVLPTFNERENVREMVGAVRRALDTDVLVVDDNSPDGTGAIADELAAAGRRVHVLHRAAKEGLGPAYVAGFRWALDRGYDRVIQMDCDFSHAPGELARLVAASRTADLVIGSRYTPGGSTQGWSPGRRLLSRGGNLYASFLLGADVRDWTAGYRCFTADLLRRLDMSRLRGTGYFFQIEMTWAARRAGAVIREVPVEFVERRKGKSKMTFGIALEAFHRVPRLRLRRDP
jgi:dolichol-phosphate mannosyltransferase